MDTLMVILDEVKPRYIFEWGSGKSTEIMSMYPSVRRIVSVEHDPEWFHKITRNKNVSPVLQSDMSKYATEIDGEIPQDLIFVDGKNRNECLELALDHLAPYGVVMLHDAARSEYVTSMYPYKIYTDDGHTCTLMQSKHMYDVLSKKLADLTNIIGVKSCA
jgi:predicted O-methyltransferase YrrM